MKKLIILALTALTAATASYAQPQPSTTVRAEVTVEKQVIRTGPYARFAQKLLGAVAPLTDKQICTVTGASLAAIQQGEAAPVASAAPAKPCMAAMPALQPVSHTRNALEFVKVPVDRHDLTERSLEESARDAANTIFSLRKHRIELITGMAGENVFGAGLPAALAEIDRMEEEYLSLFMGKQALARETKIYEIVPAAGETTRVVCRFSDSDGLLPESDLSGSPVVLELKPVGEPAPQPQPAAKPAKNAPPTVRQYVPATVNCRLLEGKNELARQTLSIYQLGGAIDVPVAGK